MKMSKYDIKAVVCGYGIYENGELKIIVNSQANALLIKYVLEQDLQHKIVIADLLEKTSKKKRKLRAMTYKEHCKSLCLICEDCIFAPNWADKYYKHICPIWNKSSNDFDKPCKLPNGKYILIEVKE
jgi:hypothetical protein